MMNPEVNAGQASYFSAREDAYHHLGTITTGALNAKDALKTAHLADWNVRKVPLTANVPLDLGGGVTTSVDVPMPDHFAVVRDNPVIEGQIDSLHVAKGRYEVLQNEVMTDLLDAIVDTSGAHYETAGAIDGGRKVFVQMRLPDSIMVGDVDRVDTYIAVMTSHDGTLPMVILPTPVRLTCGNTMNLAYRNATSMFKVRHTSGATQGVVQQAREALGFTFKYLERFQEAADQLINTTLGQVTFEQIVSIEYGAEEGAKAGTATRAQNKVDKLMELFADAQTQEGIRGTAWAGLNALTEYQDHFAPVRGSDTNRSRNAILDPKAKNRALELMMAL